MSDDILARAKEALAARERADGDWLCEDARKFWSIIHDDLIGILQAFVSQAERIAALERCLKEACELCEYCGGDGHYTTLIERLNSEAEREVECHRCKEWRTELAKARP